MSGEDEQKTVTAADEVAPQTGKLNVQEALQEVLKRSLTHDGLARGIREGTKALDRKQAHLAVLAESCNEQQYVKLVEGLCAEHQIPLIKVKDGKLLGQWAGLCTIDREGNARKVVGASLVVVKNWGEDSEARTVLLDYFQSR